MPDFAAALASGHAWLYLPTALLLGALHALEPGHAKSMMAGFIVATRGTPGQAVLLGTSAAISHSLVVWALVLTALWLGREILPEAYEPYLGIAAGGIALAVAAWMAWNLIRTGETHSHRHGAHGHDHDHVHHDHAHDHDHDHDHPHPHDHGHLHGADAHNHAQAAPSGGTETARATNAQVIAFGLTGGLMPCPAALVVLALCLNVGAVGLGVATVAAFSLGLALVLVGVGLAASLALKAAGNAAPRLASWGRHLPWLSVAVILLSGLWTISHAIQKLPAH
ncbi:nickel/cobalt efflux transporter [Roseomonas sp. WA12]